MRIKYAFIGLVMFLYILTNGGFAAADTPVIVKITNSSDWDTWPDWTLAGGPYISTIEIEVLNSSGQPLNGSEITAYVELPLMGNITTQNPLTTNNEGRVSFTFKPGTKSGVAWLTFRINSTAPSIDPPIIKQHSINIDHAGPVYILSPNYIAKVPVGDETDILIKFRDIYGNFLDDRREEEKFSIMFNANGTSGYFIEPWKSQYISMLTSVNSTTRNIEGYAKYIVPELAGNNWIYLSTGNTSQIDPDSLFIVITGYGTIPKSITYSTNPLDGITYAQKDHHIDLFYTVTDQWGNPIDNTKLWWNTSTDESKNFTTNYKGNVFLEYGEDHVQNVTITVSLFENPNVNISHIVRFIQPPALMFDLTAVPQMMPSRDVPGKDIFTAKILAKVINIQGDAVLDEVVKFEVIYPTLKCNKIDFSNATIYGLPYLKGDDPNDLISIITVPTSSLTDGYALAEFFAGSFPTSAADPNYDMNSECNITIRATWLKNPTNSKNITIGYVNYPFLRVDTKVDKTILNVSEQVCTTIGIYGDGWAFYPKPIDVVLLDNRGESMLGDMYWGYNPDLAEDKLVYIYDTSEFFLDEMIHDIDRVSVISFGIKGLTDLPDSSSQYSKGQPGDDGNASDINPYIEENYKNYPFDYNWYAYREIDFTSDFEAVMDALYDITPSKDPKGTVIVPIREGLYQSLNYLNSDEARPDAVKAIVLLTDSSWTTFGDPIAGWDKGKVSAQNAYTIEEKPPTANWPQGGLSAWTSYDIEIFNVVDTDKSSPYQNMAYYASKSKIKIFTIAYFIKGTKIPTSLNNTLNELAVSTGGDYFKADDAEQLAEIYKKIAGMLREQAAVDTEVVLDFGLINVSHEDKMPEEVNGSDVFDYIPILPGLSTHITRYDDYTIDLINSTLTYDEDNTQDWIDNSSFSWEVGNISINEGWESTFCFIAKMNGSINLFGPNSYLHYNNPITEEGVIVDLKIPDTYITVLGFWEGPLTSKESIILSNLSVTPGGSSELLNFTWELNYTGKRSATQLVYYQYSPYEDVWTNDWILFDQKTNSAATNSINGTYSSLLDVRDRVGYVKFMVFAFENFPGGSSDRKEINASIIGILGPRILIQ